MGAEDKVTDVLRAALARTREPDPHVVARRLWPRLTEQQRQEVGMWGLEQRARVEIGHQRMHATAPAPVAKTGPSRWAIAGPVAPAGEWKLLDECTVDDLLVLAEEYRARSEQNAAKEREFRALAEDLKRSGCATIGEMRARKDLAA